MTLNSHMALMNLKQLYDLFELDDLCREVNYKMYLCPYGPPTNIDIRTNRVGTSC